MSQQEFDDAMCVLKIQRLDEDGVAAAYSDLDTYFSGLRSIQIY